jgi:hypothetical protein
MNTDNTAYVVYNITKKFYVATDYGSGGYAYMTNFIFAKLMPSCEQAEELLRQCASQYKEDTFVIRKVSVEALEGDS